MSTLWRKAVRDFWQEKTRSLLVVAAIATGIAAFSAVLSCYAILDRELNEGYLATNPASIDLRTDRVDADLLALLRANPGVAAAEARRTVSGKVKVGPAQWRNLLLFVVEDYADIRVGVITHEAGAWPAGRGEILIERDAFQVAKTRIGEMVTIKLPRGEDQALRVTGRVHDVGQAQARMENVVYGYVTLETLALLGEDPYLDQLKVLVSGDRFDKAHIATVAADLREVLTQRGHPVRRLDLPEPGKHPHAELMGMLLLAISSFGLLVLALSGVLVVNLLTALMAAQVRQIGMMKAIGGTRRQIAGLYLGQALLLGLAAVVIAVPLGMLGARALCRSLAVFLNFDVTSFAVPAWVYLLVALVGLSTPLLAAAWPVAKGSGVSVWTALLDTGVSDRGFGAGAFDRALAGVGGVTRPVLLAMRNSFRRRTRLALTLLTLSTGGVFFMSALNVRASMIGTLDHLFASRRFDLSVNLGTLYPAEPVARAMAKTPGVRRFEGWIATEGAVVTPLEAGASSTPSAGHGGGASGGLHGGGTGSAAARFPVLGVQPGTRLLALDIGEGCDLLPDETATLVANSALAARHPQFRVGQTVMLAMGPATTPWRVVGISREAFSPPVAYVSRTYFERAGGHEGMANTLRVALEQPDPASIDRFKEELDRNLSAEGVRALSSTSKAESRYGFDQHMLMIYVFLIVVSAIIGGVGGLGLMTTMSLNVLERRREMGVLRAIGASSRVVGLIVVSEGLTIGLISFGLAAIVAGPLSHGLGRLLSNVMFGSELVSSFDPSGLAIWLVVSLALSGIASFAPAWNAARAPVREALDFE